MQRKSIKASLLQSAILNQDVIAAISCFKFQSQAWKPSTSLESFTCNLLVRCKEMHSQSPILACCQTICCKVVLRDMFSLDMEFVFGFWLLVFGVVTLLLYFAWFVSKVMSQLPQDHQIGRLLDLYFT